MIKNLNTAEKLVKLGAAILMIILYCTEMIIGPIANVLMLLSGIVIYIYFMKLLFQQRKQ
jgi:hypothetical protein